MNRMPHPDATLFALVTGPSPFVPPDAVWHAAALSLTSHRPLSNTLVARCAVLVCPVPLRPSVRSGDSPPAVYANAALLLPSPPVLITSLCSPSIFRSVVLARLRLRLPRARYGRPQSAEQILPARL